MIVKQTFPTKFKPLLQPSRYKVVFGGRGSSKSWSVARALLIKAWERPIRILCTREIQRSIQDSVHRLLSDQIIALNLSAHFQVKNNYISGDNGSLFLFEGLWNNVDKIKSMEGVDVCWVEEAHHITEKSWDILTPTIRKEASEIWMTFNPDRDDDPTYIRFIKNRRPDSVLIKVNYTDNPYFAEPLISDMEYDKQYSYSKYLNIWEGEPITNYESLVYRFTNKTNVVEKELKYNEGIETCCSWDFGVNDDTAIIFYQILQVPKTAENKKGILINIFDEYVNNNQDTGHYKKLVDSKGYLMDRHYCDPSGHSRDSSLMSWVDKLGYPFYWSHQYSPTEMIDNANDYLPFVRINQHQTPKMYEMFRRWQYKTDRDGKVMIPPRPEHDEYSHLGTSFYYMTSNRFPPQRLAAQKAKLR